MACNATASEEPLCGGVGQCDVVDGVAECTCPQGYSVLYNCERSHYGIEPQLALIVSVTLLIPFVLLTGLYVYEYIWGFVRRPKTRWNLLQVFKLVMLLFCLTRVWECLHIIINSQIGHTVVWGTAARQITVSTGLMSMLIALAMVVSLWYDMVLSIQKIDSESSSASRYVRWGLMISGGILFVVGVAGGIYGAFLRTLAVVLTYTVFAAAYTITFITIAIIALSKSRRFWCQRRKKTSAASEFTRKVKIMIGWVCICISYAACGLIFNVSNFKSSPMFFVVFAIYTTLELLVACLSLAFNQHYIYPFKGLRCLGAGVSISATQSRGSRDSSQFTMSNTNSTMKKPNAMSTATSTYPTLQMTTQAPEGEGAGSGSGSGIASSSFDINGSGSGDITDKVESETSPSTSVSDSVSSNASSLYSSSSSPTTYSATSSSAATVEM